MWKIVGVYWMINFVFHLSAGHIHLDVSISQLYSFFNRMLSQKLVDRPNRTSPNQYHFGRRNQFMKVHLRRQLVHEIWLHAPKRCSNFSTIWPDLSISFWPNTSLSLGHEFIHSNYTVKVSGLYHTNNATSYRSPLELLVPRQICVKNVHHSLSTPAIPRRLLPAWRIEIADLSQAAVHFNSLWDCGQKLGKMGLKYEQQFLH